MVEQLVVLQDGFAEADAGVDDQLGAAQAGPEGPLDRPAQAFLHVAQDVLGRGDLLHGFGGAADVHQDEGHLVAAGEPGQARVGAQAADVVDHLGPGPQGGFRHLRLGGVDRDRDAQPGLQPAEHREDALQFFLGGDAAGARAGGLAANVKDVGAGALHLERVGHSPVGVEEPPAVAEGIRGDVQDAHHQGALAQHQHRGGQRQGKLLANRSRGRHR